jgi:hypothetical protein
MVDRDSRAAASAVAGRNAATPRGQRRRLHGGWQTQATRRDGVPVAEGEAMASPLVLRAAASLVVAAGAAVALPACGLSCTDIGWFEGFTLEIAGSAPFRDGSYQLALVADGIEERLAFTVDGDVFTCAAGCVIGADNRLTGRLDGVGAIDGGIGTLELHVARDGGGGPARIDVVLRFGADVIGNATFTPDYRREEINGDGCGVATFASDDLVVLYPGT